MHCDLFGTCPHQNLSSNSWHPPHPVDWTNLQQSLNHHLQAEEEDCQHCSAPYLSISQFGSPFWRFKGQHESGLVSVVIEVGKPGAVKSTALVLQWVSSEDSTHLPLGHVPDEYISHLTHHPASKLIKQSKAYKILRYIKTRESWGWDYLLPGWLFQTCTDMYLCTRPYMFDIVWFGDLNTNQFSQCEHRLWKQPSSGSLALIIRFMEELLHHLGCRISPCKAWDKLSINCRSSGVLWISNQLYFHQIDQQHLRWNTPIRFTKKLSSVVHAAKIPDVRAAPFLRWAMQWEQGRIYLIYMLIDVFFNYLHGHRDVKGSSS